MSENFILRSKKPSFEIPLKSVGKILWERLKELNDETTCIIEAKTETKITLKEFLSQANSVAVALIKRGITKTEKFCIFSHNTIRYYVLVYASYFLGVTLMPFSPAYAIYELRKDIENLESIVIFTSVANTKYFDEIIEDFNTNETQKQKIKSVFVLDENHDNYIPFEKLLQEGKDQFLDRIPYFDVDPKKDILLLLRSSGTTGLPKTAIISHYSFIASVLDFWKSKQFDNIRVLLTLSSGHIGTLLFQFVWFSSGATIVMLEKNEEELWFESVEKYRINLLFIFPAMGHKLVKGELADKYDFSSVKIMFTGAAPFPGNVAEDIVKKYNVIFREVYGMTEFMPISEYPDLEYTEFIPNNNAHVSRNTELKIIDLKTGQSLGPNSKGEICVKGPKMFMGYLNDTKATKETIDNDGWLHTGDIGHYDTNERLFITDRIKEIIKYCGWAVSPVEIEQFLLTHESVAEVVVVGVKHETEHQWPRAYVKVKDGKSVAEEELEKYVSETMGYINELRAGVVFVDEIPRLTVGKIDRKYFKKLVSNEVIKNDSKIFIQ